MLTKKNWFFMTDEERAEKEKQQQIDAWGFYAEVITPELQEKYDLKNIDTRHSLVITSLEDSNNHEYKRQHGNEDVELKVGDLLTKVNRGEIEVSEDKSAYETILSRISRYKKNAGLNKPIKLCLSLKRKNENTNEYNEIEVLSKFTFDDNNLPKEKVIVDKTVMVKNILSVLILSLFILASSCFAADDKYVILDIEGEGKNRSEAIEAAWVEGIRQAVGSFVDAKTELNDDQLTERIVQYSRAIVDKYEITSVDDSKADDGIYKLKMRVWIVREILRDGARHATGGEAVISLTPSDFKKQREESSHKELEAKNAAAVTQQAKAKSAAEILEAMLDRYKPEDFLTCYIPGKPEPVKDKQDFFTLNVEINFNEKLYKEAFVPDLIQVLDQIASVKKNTLLSKYKKELRDLAAKKELTNVKNSVFFQPFIDEGIDKGYVLSVYNKPERFGARLYGFKDNEEREIRNALKFFFSRTQRFNGIVVDFIDEDKEVMGTIEKKFALRYLITANNIGLYAVHPSILRVSGNASIESTKVVIPVELEMPEEILPYVKNIKASLLLGDEPIRQLGGWLGLIVEQEKDKVVVRKFDAGSPAVKSSISRGDVIITIDGREIKTVKDFNEFMNKTRAGQIISIRYLNNGTERTTSITLGKRP